MQEITDISLCVQLCTSCLSLHARDDESVEYAQQQERQQRHHEHVHVDVVDHVDLIVQRCRADLDHRRRRLRRARMQTELAEAQHVVSCGHDQHTENDEACNAWRRVVRKLE